MADANRSGALLDAVRDEIEAVHRFIAAWFRGEMSQTAACFEAGFAGRVDADLVNIQPAGLALSREALLSSIEKGFGTNPRFEIEIRDVRIPFVCERSGLLLATYVEVQRGALQTTPPENVRISTVLLQRDIASGSFTWLHIHETAIGPAA